jgi:NADP-dependent 3-hydroxy acid dehydrogenase YdfG
MHAVLDGMRERGDGVLITVSSIAGVRTSVLGGASYSASKHGVRSLSLAAHLEEGPRGIRSCVISPGEVNTPILDLRPVVPSEEKRALMLQPEDVAQAALLVATLHPRACIPELVIAPTNQAYS